jgi:small subunit ribosomal protein S4
MKVGPKYKICRAVGDEVFGKCQTPKYQLSRAKKQGATKGGRKRGKTEYGNQLTEKQKVRYTYYVSEKQFSTYVKNAQKNKTEPHNVLFYQLETRLDNIVYRAGFAPSRAFARQAVSHGHILVNGIRVKIPSFHVSKGDVISVRVGSRGKGIFGRLKELNEGKTAAAWLAVDYSKYEVTLTEEPRDPQGTEASLDFNTVIEFYSRV